MRFERPHAWCLALAAACSTAEDAALPIAVCDDDAPAQILALDDDQAIMPSDGVARAGDRWLFGVRTFEIPLTKVNTALAPFDQREYDQIEAAIVSVDECGEDRGIVVEGADVLQPPTEDGGPWLACRADTGELFWFDPEGAFPPHQLPTSAFCNGTLVRGNEAFVWRRDDSSFARVRLDRPDPEVETLVEDVIEAPHAFGHVPGVELDDVFLMRIDRTVVNVGLRTGVAQTEQENVGSFSISDDRRWFAWTTLPLDENDTPSSTWLRDRRTGDEHPLGRTSWSFTAMFVVVRSVFEPPAKLLVVDLETGEQTPIEDVTLNFDVEDDAMLFLDFDVYSHFDLPRAFKPYDLVRMSLTTLEREVVRSRVFSDLGPIGDRWVVGSDVDENFLVDLHLLDGVTLESQRFARNVVPGSFVSDSQEPAVNELGVIYQVHERATDNGGMWRVAFTP